MSSMMNLLNFVVIITFIDEKKDRLHHLKGEEGGGQNSKRR